MLFNYDIIDLSIVQYSIAEVAPGVVLERR